jgi:5-bromo-4-chloroindolyl phosphate hydrolysis protein
MQCTSEKFLTGEIEDIESLTSVRQANEFLNQMRNLFRKLKQESANLLAAEEHVRSDKIGSAEE